MKLDFYVLFVGYFSPSRDRAAIAALNKESKTLLQPRAAFPRAENYSGLTF